MEDPEKPKPRKYLPVDTTRHHRENLWDYKGRAIYHITLNVEQRYPLFGELAGDDEAHAHIQLTEMGRFVRDTFEGLPTFYRAKGCSIRILALKVMPDHLHGVIHVVEPMPKSIGEVIRSFKSACTSHFKRQYFCLLNNEQERQSDAQEPINNEPASAHQPSATEKHPASAQQPPTTEEQPASAQQPPTTEEQPVSALQPPTTEEHPVSAHQPPTIEEQAWQHKLVHFCRIFATRTSIWEYMPAGYHERILHCDGQLDRMICYVKDNPRRLWLKRHNPQLFKMRHGLTITTSSATDSTSHTWQFRAMGNMFLLHFPLRQYVQCSRSLTPQQIEAQMAQTLVLAAQGYVTISAAISEGEKQIVKAIRQAAFPVIILLRDGFPADGSPRESFYKPGGVYFNACANGLLLLMEPLKSVFDDNDIANIVYRISPFATKDSKRYQFLVLNHIAASLANDDIHIE